MASFKSYTTSSRNSLKPQFWTLSKLNTSLPGQLLEQFLRLPLWGALLAAVVSWAVQQGGIPFILSGWTILSTLVVPMLPCIFASLLPMTSNPMYSLLNLLGVFFSTVLYYLGRGAEYIGLTIMIVYVGAVSVIFLFVLMLLNGKGGVLIQTLLIYNTQHLTGFALVVLFIRVITHVYMPAEVFIASREGSSCVNEPTSAEAIEFFIRYEFNDIAGFVPLYTHHGVPFLVLTAILLSALLGAIILATQTTERPVPERFARRAHEEKACAAFSSAILLTILADDCLHADAFSAMTTPPTAYILVTVSFFKRWYPAIPAPADDSPKPRGRYWRWRSSRAVALVRERFGVWDTTSKVARPFSVSKRDFVFDAKYGRVLRKYSSHRGGQYVLFRIPSYFELTVPPVRLPSPPTLKQRFLRRWHLHIRPTTLFLAGRIYAFCPVFAVFFLGVPALLFFISLVAEDYHVTWCDLCRLHKALSEQLPAGVSWFSATPRAVQENIICLLLLPAGVLSLLLTYYWLFALLALVLTVEHMQADSSLLAATLQNLKTTKLHGQYAHQNLVVPPEEEPFVYSNDEALERAQRHPDKGRENSALFLFGLLSVTPTVVPQTVPIASLMGINVRPRYFLGFPPETIFDLSGVLTLLFFLAYVYAVAGIVVHHLGPLELQRGILQRHPTVFCAVRAAFVATLAVCALINTSLYTFWAQYPPLVGNFFRRYIHDVLNVQALHYSDFKFFVVAWIIFPAVLVLALWWYARFSARTARETRSRAVRALRLATNTRLRVGGWLLRAERGTLPAWSQAARVKRRFIRKALRSPVKRNRSFAK